MRGFIDKLAVIFAMVGGLMLIGIALISSGSIVARWLADTPLLGDVELVQIGCAMSIALFMPYCQLKRGHIIVDFFTHNARPITRHRLDAVGAALSAAIFFVLAWRAGIGVLDMRASGETTMLLQMPGWLSYLVMVPALALSGLIGLMAARDHWQGSS